MSLGCNEHSLETLILVQMTFLMYRFIEFPEPLLRYVVLLSGVITFLPDPGVSGVRSMGPGLSMYLRPTPLVETLLM